MAWTDPATWTVGELVLASKMNTHIRDNFLATGPHLMVRKLADESVTSSIVLQDDNHLFFSIGANEVWHVRFELMVRGSTAGNIKYAFTGPSGCLPVLGNVWKDNTSTTLAQSWASLAPTARSLETTEGATVSTFHSIAGFVVNSSTAGTFTLQWAQASSNATATTVMTNSLLLGMKVA